MRLLPAASTKAALERKVLVSYMYRRRHRATPLERFRMDLRYFFRKDFKHVVSCVGEALLGIAWFFGTIFLIPVFAALFH